MIHSRRARLAAFGLLLVYVLLAVLFLDRVPTAHEDEPWIASTGWSLAEHGVFGSPMFRGLAHMEERYYEFMPLYPIVQAVLFRGAGVGLFQARFVSAAAGALTLCLTFAIGSRLFGSATGLLAMALLLAARTARATDFLPTGILFLDVNRLARYDALVPVLGLSALGFFLVARARQKPWFYFASGLLAGLSALTHLYGGFWGAALLLLALRGPHRSASLRAIFAGLALPWLLYGLYVVTGFEAWYAQEQFWNANRFRLLDPAWYAQNILNERSRYAFLDLELGRGAPTGAQLALIGWVVTFAILIWRALRMDDHAAQVLSVTTTCLMVGLALFVDNKVPNYLLTLAPLVALTCSWGVTQLWVLAARTQYRGVLHAALLVPLFLLLGDSLPPLMQVYVNAATVTPYEQVVNAVRGDIEPGTRVLGLHSTWFAFSDMEYRDLIAVFERAQQLRAQPNPLATGLSEFNPRVIVLDPRLRAYFENARADSRPAQIKAWMQEQNFQCVWSVGEATHGYFEIYRRVSDAVYKAWDGTCQIHLNKFSRGALPFGSRRLG